jgi:hypothetical protein
MQITTKQAAVYIGLIVLCLAIICYIVPKVLGFLFAAIVVLTSVVLVGGLVYLIVRYFKK